MDLCIHHGIYMLLYMHACVILLFTFICRNSLYLLYNNKWDIACLNNIYYIHIITYIYCLCFNVKYGPWFIIHYDFGFFGIEFLGTLPDDARIYGIYSQTVVRCRVYKNIHCIHIICISNKEENFQGSFIYMYTHCL